MVWKAEPVKHFLEVTHIGAEGRNFATSREYTPDRYNTDISLSLSKEDTELRVKPYTLECLNNTLNGRKTPGKMTKLFVGIRDETKIAYVGFYWMDQHVKGFKRVNQYFFSDDQPSGFDFGNMSGPGWPTNQPAVIDESLMPHFVDLRSFRPQVLESLDRCVELLSVPGPEYTGVSDGSIAFKIDLRKR